MFWEIIGYIGTALVIISMLMTNIDRLRFINICGGFLSLVYAISVKAPPIVVLNATLVTINIIQLIRSRINRRRFASQAQSDDEISDNNEEGDTL